MLLVMMILSAIAVGVVAQLWKGYVGALWGFIVFLLEIFFFISLVYVARNQLFEDETFDLAVALGYLFYELSTGGLLRLVLCWIGITFILFLIVATLPNRKKASLSSYLGGR
jgi:hypothetical protein